MYHSNTKNKLSIMKRILLAVIFAVCAFSGYAQVEIKGEEKEMFRIDFTGNSAPSIPENKRFNITITGHLNGISEVGDTCQLKNAQIEVAPVTETFSPETITSDENGFFRYVKRTNKKVKDLNFRLKASAPGYEPVDSVVTLKDVQYGENHNLLLFIGLYLKQAASKKDKIGEANKE